MIKSAPVRALMSLFPPAVGQRLQSLVWSCLDSDLSKTAVFYAERYYALDSSNEDARHLYATALLRHGQPHSALHLVRAPRGLPCTGCLELKAKCCTALGRHRQAKEALDECLRDQSSASSSSQSTRTARSFPDEAAIRCRAGNMALKGNLLEDASVNFRQALTLNPLVFEAFEGLCAVGTVPEIEEIFPPRPVPTKRGPSEDPQPKPVVPVASGAGFFTPDTANSGSLFRPLQPMPFRMPPLGNESIEISFYPQDTTFQQVHPPGRQQSNPSRPLSSADEAGPVAKKLRSAAPQQESSRTNKPSKLSVDEPLKKAGSRPALKLSSLFSSSARSSQPSTSSRAASSSNNHVGTSSSTTTTRRSGRPNNSTSSKPGYVSKTSTRGRRRQPTQTTKTTVESDMEDNYQSPSPPPFAQSPRSEKSQSPSNWTAAHEQAAQDAYEWELADHHVYELVRQFATATRALALYDPPGCLAELERLPNEQQRTPFVLAMAGKAHYEQLQYANAERAFRSLRMLEPYRLMDMEVYSTLLWHLQRNVELSFLAQELLSVDPKSSQAWIAIGNLFSLQKERAQALTCFRRAAQLDPSCAYAYTLSGHESIDENLDRAIAYFQSALRVDPRHYNAWYGLGTCYLRMSKVRLAEYHYRKSMAIHPRNAVLLGCVGMTVERRGDRDAALALFDEAVRLAPENALVRYRRAKILILTKNYDAAVMDLETLRSTSPEESNVVFQLAKVYRLLGDEVKAAQLLAIARDISPKSLSKIKKLLDTVKDESAEDRMDEG
ncbi:TPR-REGION domain-containing protein [Mycena indigotica]|uniref:TPR-REGION domain-containing protein n=1 Tax=Mycena indigotica TaxID=2126181 RepID=A0A8H6VV64_9AGAR|nr:TPR-REGION domain-containing protein [Mycena indigotica]KAF7295067.1 TPR-REGION domain-containing protein [Mycena indigotica]